TGMGIRAKLRSLPRRSTVVQSNAPVTDYPLTAGLPTLHGFSQPLRASRPRNADSRTLRRARIPLLAADDYLPGPPPLPTRGPPDPEGLRPHRSRERVAVRPLSPALRPLRGAEGLAGRRLRPPPHTDSDRPVVVRVHRLDRPDPPAAQRTLVRVHGDAAGAV